MSFKEKVEKATALVEQLGKAIISVFPEAAEVDANIGQIAQEAKKAILEELDVVQKAVDSYGKPKVDTFTIFRHVRDGQVIDGKTVVAPTGGVTFFIRVDHKPTPIITFSISIQDKDRNFSYRLGRNVSRGRFIAGQTISHPYVADASLVSNILNVLRNYAWNIGLAEIKEELISKKINPNDVVKAFHMMDDFVKTLPREQPGDPR